MPTDQGGTAPPIDLETLPCTPREIFPEDRAAVVAAAAREADVARSRVEAIARAGRGLRPSGAGDSASVDGSSFARGLVEKNGLAAILVNKQEDAERTFSEERSGAAARYAAGGLASVVGEPGFSAIRPSNDGELALASDSDAAEVDIARGYTCLGCLDPLTSGRSGRLCTLPSTHIFHAAYVEEVRSSGIKQICPVCRTELPPGPEKPSEETAEDTYARALIEDYAWVAIREIRDDEERMRRAEEYRERAAADDAVALPAAEASASHSSDSAARAVVAAAMARAVVGAAREETRSARAETAGAGARAAASELAACAAVKAKEGVEHAAADAAAATAAAEARADFSSARAEAEKAARVAAEAELACSAAAARKERLAAAAEVETLRREMQSLAHRLQEEEARHASTAATAAAASATATAAADTASHASTAAATATAAAAAAAAAWAQREAYLEGCCGAAEGRCCELVARLAASGDALAAAEASWKAERQRLQGEAARRAWALSQLQATASRDAAAAAAGAAVTAARHAEAVAALEQRLAEHKAAAQAAEEALSRGLAASGAALAEEQDKAAAAERELRGQAKGLADELAASAASLATCEASRGALAEEGDALRTALAERADAVDALEELCLVQVRFDCPQPAVLGSAVRSAVVYISVYIYFFKKLDVCQLAGDGLLCL